MNPSKDRATSKMLEPNARACSDEAIGVPKSSGCWHYLAGPARYVRFPVRRSARPPGDL